MFFAYCLPTFEVRDGELLEVDVKLVEGLNGMPDDLWQEARHAESICVFQGPTCVE